MCFLTLFALFHNVLVKFLGHHANISIYHNFHLIFPKSLDNCMYIVRLT